MDERSGEVNRSLKLFINATVNPFEFASEEDSLSNEISAFKEIVSTIFGSVEIVSK